jgi:hypothetical protein
MFSSHKSSSVTRHSVSTSEPLNVKLLVAIVVLWAIALVHLAFSLPREITNPDAVVRGEHKVN